jgi:hypothetical protein
MMTFAAALGVAGLAFAQTVPDNSAAARAMTPSMGMPQTPGTPLPGSNPGTMPVAPPSYGVSGTSGADNSAPGNPGAGVTNPYASGGPAVSFGAAPPPITSPGR